jgi:hypothetical protein
MKRVLSAQNHHKGFKKKLNSFQENDKNSGNSDEIQRSDSNKGKYKEGSSDEGQKDDKLKKEKRAYIYGNDEELGKRWNRGSQSN